jgi:hypothetical protein
LVVDPDNSPFMRKAHKHFSALSRGSNQSAADPKRNPGTRAFRQGPTQALPM